MKEKRKRKIALRVIRFLLRESGIQQSGFRREILEARESIGISAKVIDRFFDTLACENAERIVDKEIRGTRIPRASREIVRMTLATPRS